MRILLLTLCLTLFSLPVWATGAADDGADAPASPAASSGAFPGLDDLIARARNQEPGAQEALGNRYEKGNGVPQDYATAAKWYRMAAMQGFTKAQTELGILYAHGKGVTQDYEEAYFWLSISFDPFNTDANKVMDQVKSYLTSEQQEKIQNRINSWRPHRLNTSSGADFGESKNGGQCSLSGVVTTLSMPSHPKAVCVDAFKEMQYVCGAASGNSCADCHAAFNKYNLACNGVEDENPTYRCQADTDCGLIDTNCSRAYNPSAANKEFMDQARKIGGYPPEGCDRTPAILQTYRAVCVDSQCKAAQSGK